MVKICSHPAVLQEYTKNNKTTSTILYHIELKKHLDELDSEQEVVAYCRGPHCVLAFEAVAQLREKGINTRHLQDSFPEWKASGLPVEQ